MLGLRDADREGRTDWTIKDLRKSDVVGGTA